MTARARERCSCGARITVRGERMVVEGQLDAFRAAHSMCRTTPTVELAVSPIYEHPASCACVWCQDNWTGS